MMRTGVVPLSRQLGWQTAAAEKSVNVAIIYMTTLKLANNTDCLLEAKWPDGFYKQRKTDHKKQ